MGISIGRRTYEQMRERLNGEGGIPGFPGFPGFPGQPTGTLQEQVDESLIAVSFVLEHVKYFQVRVLKECGNIHSQCARLNLI